MMAIYIIQCGEQPFVKIGKADDPEKRRRALQGAHYESLHIIRTVPASMPRCSSVPVSDATISATSGIDPTRT
jgi:hypothetical protein